MSNTMSETDLRGGDWQRLQDDLILSFEYADPSYVDKRFKNGTGWMSSFARRDDTNYAFIDTIRFYEDNEDLLSARTPETVITCTLGDLSIRLHSQEGLLPNELTGEVPSDDLAAYVAYGAIHRLTKDMPNLPEEFKIPETIASIDLPIDFPKAA